MGRSSLLAVRLGSLLLLLAAPLICQPEPPTFSFVERVVATDLVVEILENGEPAGWLAGDGTDPTELDALAASLELRLEGSPLEITAVEPAGLQSDWQVVLYFDQELASTFELRFGAGLLAAVSHRLVELGGVTLVLADPKPRILLGPTRDSEQLEASLSRLALQGTADDALLGLRFELLQAERSLQEGEELGLSAEELGELYLEEESRLVLHRQDTLLHWLTGHRGTGPRRALLLVGSLQDLDPLTLYRSPGASDEASARLRARADQLTDETERAAQTLAAYGWTPLAILAPDRPPTVRGGLRIGKFRLSPSPAILGVRLAHEEDRDPEKADAYVQLGRSLRRQGKLDEAVEAFRQAIVHYYGDRKTLRREGTAFVELASTLEELNRPAAALRAQQTASLLLCLDREGGGRDPQSGCARPQTESPFPLSRITSSRLEPMPALEQLATAGAGEVVRSEEELVEGLDRLRHRVRLSYQLPESFDGRLRRVTLVSRQAQIVLRYPAWIRSSTPRRLAAARLRLLLAGRSLAPELELTARPPGDLLPDSLLLEARDPLAPEVPTEVTVEAGETLRRRPLRLSVGLDRGFGQVRIDHRETEWRRGEGGRLTLLARVPPRSEDELLAFVVEDLITERWAALFVDDPD